MFNSLWAHGLQHTRLLCPSLSCGVFSNSFPLSQWYYITISFPASGFFWMSWLFAQGDQNTGIAASAWSFSPPNEYWLISFRFDLAVQGTFRSLLQHHNSKASTLWHSDFFMVQLSYLYMTTRKAIALTVQTFVSFDYSEEQGSLVCCCPWGWQRAGHDLMTEQQQSLLAK